MKHVLAYLLYQIIRPWMTLEGAADSVSLDLTFEAKPWRREPEFSFRSELMTIRQHSHSKKQTVPGKEWWVLESSCMVDPSLPGADLIECGIRDLREERETIEALLVAIGEPRLRRIGLDLPPIPYINPEHRLYDLLATDDPDAAHSRYNALIRRLVSFERAAECVKE